MRVPIVATILGALIWWVGIVDQAQAGSCCRLATGCINASVQDCRLVHMGTFESGKDCVGGVCVNKPSGGEG